MSVSSDKIPTVLIVDDEEAICVLIKMSLESMGYVTRIAKSGDDALEILREGWVNAVISDQDLPGMKGTELYKRACMLQPELRERFLFITGNSGLTAADFPARLLHKPFDISVLGETVQSLVAAPRHHAARC